MLKKEIETYEAQKSKLVGESKGKFALVKDDQVIDVFDSKSMQFDKATSVLEMFLS